VFLSLLKQWAERLSDVSQAQLRGLGEPLSIPLELFLLELQIGFQSSA
jgi:hypothetical protein